jgi:hypothetical protein
MRRWVEVEARAQERGREPKRDSTAGDPGNKSPDTRGGNRSSVRGPFLGAVQLSLTEMTVADFGTAVHYAIAENERIGMQGNAPLLRQHVPDRHYPLKKKVPGH